MYIYKKYVGYFPSPQYVVINTICEYMCTRATRGMKKNIRASNVYKSKKQEQFKCPSVIEWIRTLVY